MLQTWTLENNFLDFRNIDNHFVDGGNSA